MDKFQPNTPHVGDDNNHLWKKLIICLTILALALIFIGCTTIDITQTDMKTYPSISNFDFYYIHDIKQNNFSEGNYSTEGYVVKIYECPLCPEGALCKTCMINNIVISEDNEILESYSLTEKELIIFISHSNPKQFELGKKYRFSINITSSISTSEPLNDIELVGYDIIQEKSALSLCNTTYYEQKAWRVIPCDYNNSMIYRADYKGEDLPAKYFDSDLNVIADYCWGMPSPNQPESPQICFNLDKGCQYNNDICK